MRVLGLRGVRVVKIIYRSAHIRGVYVHSQRLQQKRFVGQEENVQYSASRQYQVLHCKKELAVFPSPAGMSLIKLFLGGNNLVFSRPERVWSVTSRLGTGKWLTLFYSGGWLKKQCGSIRGGGEEGVTELCAQLNTRIILFSRGVGRDGGMEEGAQKGLLGAQQNNQYRGKSKRSLTSAGTITQMRRRRGCTRRSVRSSNVKKVKEQAFQKRSKNVPISNRKKKTIQFVPQFVLSKEISSIWSRRADSGPNRNNLFSIREIRERYKKVLVLLPKRYWNFCPFVF